MVEFKELQLYLCSYYLILQALIAVRLFLFLFGLLSFSCNIFLAMIIKLCVFFSLHHFFLSLVILLCKLPRATNFFKQSCPLLGVLHGNRLHCTLEDEEVTSFDENAQLL